jgi:hypothetical protein
MGLIAAISGCVDSVSESTKHFDNGIIAFDYPSNIEVVDHGSYYCILITVYYGSNQMLNTVESNKTKYNNMDLVLKQPNPTLQLLKLQLTE